MPDYEMVMPFLVVRSKGGPYDDEAFTAGWAMGSLDARLGSLVIDPGGTYKIDVTVPPDCVPQIDLIAMKHGFACETTDTSDDHWTQVVLRRYPWNAGEVVDGP